MNCPYCLSEVSEEAVVCKTCSRDLYLFKPLIAKIADLERQVSEIPSSEKYENRISELEYLLGQQCIKNEKRSWFNWLGDITFYLIVPLALLLLAHWLIAIVYDTKMLYLRIISMILPMPFAYALFKKHSYKVFPWFFGVILLSISSVIGMSWITSLVDHTPVLPQNLLEWKEILEYAISIAFSFMTGMLLGHMSYASSHQYKNTNHHPLLKLVLGFMGDEKRSPEKLHNLMKKVNEYGGTIVALGTTGLSIYTGLKHVL